MLITVFTPTYNRAHLLPRVYESLCKQTFRDFEWVIVDDGSVDDTKGLSLTLPHREGTFFPIRYFYQENGGKHRAINRGVKEAHGELFFIADSDDWLPDDALEIVAEQYEKIKSDSTIGAVVGFDAFQDGRYVATSTPFETIDCTEIEFRHKYHVAGDMKEVFKTNVLREFPFPEIEGEKFCPEDLVWHRIAKKYKFRYFNRVIYNVEYLPTGLSAKLRKLRMDSPIASVTHYAEYNEFTLPTRQKLRNAINYWRFRFCLPVRFKKDERIPQLQWLWNIALPLGWIMHLNDLRKTR